MRKRSPTICTARSGSCRSSAIFLPGSPPSPDCCEAGDDRAGSGAVRKPAMRAARGRAQQLLLPASAGICGGTRASEAARPDFHRPSSLRQPPAPGGALARGDFGWPPARPAADEKARAVGGQAEAEHQQAASQAQGLPVPSARQDDRPGEPEPALAKAGVWAADITYIPMRQGFLYLVAIIDWATRRVLSWRLSNTPTAGFCVEALGEALARL